MKWPRLVYLGAFAYVALGGLAWGDASVEPGMSEKDLMAAKGKPLGSITAGAKTIVRWTDMTVTLQAGKVLLIEPIDAAREKSDEDRRTALNATLAAEKAAKERLAAEQAQQRQQAYQKNQEERRLAEALALPDKLAQQEKKAAATKQAAYELAWKEYQIRGLALDSELRDLKDQLARARANGDSVRVSDLASEINDKQKVWQFQNDHPPTMP